MRCLCALMVGFVALTFAASAPFAATFQVTKTADTADGVCDADCSLREAIIAANVLAGNDVVNVPAGTYQLALPGVNEDAAATGDLDITDDLSLLGAGAKTTVIDAAGIDRVFDVPHGSPTTVLAGLTITGGAGDRSGIRLVGSNTKLLRVTVQGNSFFGVSQDSGGDLRIEQSLIEDYIESTGVLSCGRGGCTCQARGTLALAHSTATLLFVPASLSSACGNDTTVTHSTLDALYFAGALMTLRGSIARSCGLAVPTPTSGGYNIDSDGTCGLTDPTDMPHTDPLLGPLQDNGGRTWTHALLPGSPAIDAIPVADCTWDDDGDPGTPEVPVATDQRGVPRAQLAACDIGAYEATECADGANNDTDPFIDAADPGCRDAASVTESPQCQDGINNDPGRDDFIDFDGGLSALGYVAAAPDPQCKDKPWRNCEFPTCCGLGFELALLLPGLMWLRRRARR